jgi:hypothetical protein
VKKYPYQTDTELWEMIPRVDVTIFIERAPSRGFSTKRDSIFTSIEAFLNLFKNKKRPAILFDNWP